MDLPPRSSLDHRLASLAAAAVPPGTRLDARPDPADLGRRLELSLARMSWEVRLGVLGALALFEWSPLLRHGRRFSRLPPEVAHRWLERWAEHRRALPRLVARMLLTFTKSYHLQWWRWQFQWRWMCRRFGAGGNCSLSSRFFQYFRTY